MTKHRYDITFVTVNYNTRDLVREMLNFFRSASLPFSHALVVVDNNSTDGSHEFLTAQDDLLYIPAGENLGYGRAINRGIQASDSRYICVLNTDVVLNGACLTRLWEFMEQT
ncbi:MAG TPA: glycosyltransferase, partial [Deltaproteobacteria bacterium]|nr:glycosyltransferase [Deltaproteobacteria bacterium]